MNKKSMGSLGSKKFLRSLALVTGVLCVLCIFPVQLYAGCGSACTNKIYVDHDTRLRPEVAQHTSNRFREHREWFLNTFFRDQVLPALQLFTEQMSATAMHQTMAIGTFFDAKHQLETQRLMQELQVQAHKDYQPSEEFCWFGSNVKSLAASEEKARANTYSMSRRQIARHMGQDNLGGADSRDSDKLARWTLFTEHFCDPQDSDWNATASGSGLRNLCVSAASGEHAANIDIDYTRLVDAPRTITMDNSSGIDAISFVNDSSIRPSKRALFSLNNNLYGHNILTRAVKPEFLKQDQYQEWYMALRSIAAKRSVAENSFNAIVGMKSEGSQALPMSGGGHGSDPEGPLVAILMELGMPQSEILAIIGQNPSYYAQLELLAKKIYQNPDFYAGLYDKPANVQRKSVALKAIELMVDRAIYESQIRQEMLSSVLLSARLREPFKEAQRALVPKAN